MIKACSTRVCLYLLKWYNQYTMKKSIYKIITIAVVCILLAVGAFISTDIIKSRQMVMEQAQDSLGYMCQNCADEFSAIFDNADLIVNDMADIASELISDEDHAKSSFASNKEMAQLKAIAEKQTENSKYPISVYYVFEHNIFIDDIWFVRGMDGEVEDMSYSDAETEQWLQEYKEESQEYIEFYNESISKDNIWYETTYDPDIKWEIVTRTKTIYDKQGDVIGIAAADVYLGDISEKLEAINKKTGGISSVTNSEDKLVAGDTNANLMIDSDKYISAVSNIDDRWNVTLLQPVSVATKAVRSTIVITFILGLIIIAGLTAMMIFVYRKHGRPIIREFEEKDVLIINQSRQAQMGEMVGNIAHQLKQPLNGVNMALSNLQEDYADFIGDDEREEFAERIGRMKKRIGGMSGTVDDFMEFLRPQKEKYMFSVKEETINMVELMKENIHIGMIETTISGEDFHIIGQKNEFGQCIFNIIDNARDAMKDIKEKEIAVTLAKERSGRGRLEGCIRISNRSSHIDEEIIDKVFDLYFTTKENTGGTGIGLYLTRSIIEKHFGGAIRCFNEEEGVCFEIRIPLEEMSEPLEEEVTGDGNAQ